MVIFYVDITSQKKYKEILSHFIREKKALKEFWMKKKLCENENKQTNQKKISNNNNIDDNGMPEILEIFHRFLLSKKIQNFFFGRLILFR